MAGEQPRALLLTGPLQTGGLKIFSAKSLQGWNKVHIFAARNMFFFMSARQNFRKEETTSPESCTSGFLVARGNGLLAVSPV